ncbi:carboxypeptidase-like regulatory domain-containing protein [Corallococcus macrosporus]|uniref:carboxypeptidase-like regulatory domain-containing protein n=1 Tax=Corallococcus macrosporus TaxID=35 RepID=UPI001EE67E21|nr:carboxypeptidase-like regulatory domain-containing protein [Corallococcus macrosporus]
MVTLGALALVAALALVRGQGSPAPRPAPARHGPSPRRLAPPTPPPRGNHSLQGRVLDAQRRPAAGIQVTATRDMPGESLSARPCDTLELELPLSSGECIGEPEERVRELVEAGHGAAPVVAQAVTSADGTFLLENLPEGTVALWAASERHATWTPAVRTDAQDVQLVLKAGLFLPGRVIAESALPLPGARLTLFHQDHARFFETRAGADGRFTFGPLPPGEYTVVATHEGLLTDSLQSVEAEELDPIVLHPPRRLSGRVLAQEQPVPGAEVHVEHTSQVTVTDDAGRFAFDSLSPGDYEVRAEHQGEHGFAMATLTEEGGDAEATVRLGTLIYLEGSVRDESGRPIARAQVGAAPPRGQSPPVDYAFTAEDGLFRLGPLRREAYIFNVLAPGYRGQLRDAVAAPGERLDFTLIPAHPLQGLVTDAQGKPVPGVYIDVDDETQADADLFREEVDPAVSDEHGRFELTFIDPGGYTLVITHDDHLEERVEVKTPGPEVRVTLRGAARVEGTVTNRQGLPIPDMLLSLVDGRGEQPTQLADTDAEGHFVITSVAPGTYDLIAGMHTGASTPEVLRTVTVRGTETVDASLRLETGASVSGIVVDEHGRPVADATVDADNLPTQLDGTSLATHTDAEGRFTLHHLMEGDCWLRASKDGYVFEDGRTPGRHSILRQGLARSGAQDVRLVLRSLGHIRGRVVRRDGSPITRFTLGEQTFRDPEGAFHVAIERAGLQRLTFEAPGLTRAVREVQVAEGEDVDLGEIRLEAGRLIRGRVVDAETSRPLEEAVVELHIPGDDDPWGEVAPVAAEVTDREGTFAFAPLEARPLDVRVRTNRGHPWFRQSIGPGDEDLELRVFPGARVEGTLTDRHGQPVEALVQLVPDGIDMSVGVEAAPGTFHATNVRAGTYTLSASSAQTLDGRLVTIHPRRVQLPPMGTVTFALTESTGTGTMRLGIRLPPRPPGSEQYQALLAGTLPPNLSAQQLRSRLRFGDLRASTRSHADTVVYENLPGGEYTFVVMVAEAEAERPPRYAVHREPLYLEEGGTLERDIQVAPRLLP